jgi:deoxyribonuclease-4
LRRLGLHLRLDKTIREVIHEAIEFQLPFFQCFLTTKNGTMVELPDADVAYFVEKRRQHFKNLYLHGSYLTNLCRARYGMHPVLEKELKRAKRLEFTHIIVHPGSARGCADNQEGINWLARALNKVLKREHDIKIVLENTAHGSCSIGGDLQDFKTLLGKLNQPEKISFCIDTAHAYSFGYDLANDVEQDAFIALIQDTITIEKVELIHLNDTHDSLGSFVDRHAIVGQGSIGEYYLRRFINNPAFVTIPLLMELPVLPHDEMSQIYQRVQHWLHE